MSTDGPGSLHRATPRTETNAANAAAQPSEEMTAKPSEKPTVIPTIIPTEMQLKVLLPTQVLVDTTVRRIVAEAPHGEFCLLPRHADYVSELVAGLLRFANEDGADEYVALSGGLLVKQGVHVFVTSADAVHGRELGRLQGMVRARFATMDAREERARSALARLEADFVRRFIELREE